MKKFISYLLVLSLCIASIAVKAAGAEFINTEISGEIPANTAPQGFNLHQVDEKNPWNSTYVRDGVGGKRAGDYSFFFQTEGWETPGGNGAGGAPFLNADQAPVYQTVTYEASILGTTTDARYAIEAGINNTQPHTFASLNRDGTIRLNDTAVGTWEPGRWYKIGAVFYQGTNKADFYLNGALALPQAAVNQIPQLAGEEKGILHYFTRMKVMTELSGGGQGQPLDNLAGFDNLRWYAGEYDPQADRVGFSVNEEEAVLESGRVWIQKSWSREEFLTAVSANGAVRVYTDRTLTQEAQLVTDGCVVVAESQNGEVLEYYTVAEAGFSTDYSIEEENRTVSGVTAGTPVGEFLEAVYPDDGVNAAVADQNGPVAQGGITNGMELVLTGQNSGAQRRWRIRTQTDLDVDFESMEPGEAFPGAFSFETVRGGEIQSVEEARGRVLWCQEAVELTAEIEQTSRRIVDFSAKQEAGTAALLINEQALLELSADGELIFGGEAVGKTEKGWHRYTIDLWGDTGFLYIDGSLMASASGEFREGGTVTIQGDGSFYLDDYAVYPAAAAFSLEQTAAQLQSVDYPVWGGKIYIPADTQVGVLRYRLARENPQLYIQVRKGDGSDMTGTMRCYSGMVVEATSADRKTTRVYTADTGTLPDLFEDFQSYPLGAMAQNKIWQVAAKPEKGGSIEITEENGTQFIRHKMAQAMSTTSSADSYLETYNCSVTAQTSIGMRIRQVTAGTGNVTVSLRGSAASSPASLNLFHISGGTISYVNQMVSAEEAIGAEWTDIDIRLDPVSGSIAVYRDGVYKAGVEDYRRANNGAVKHFSLEECRLRVYCQVYKQSTYEVCYDNIRFYAEEEREGLSLQRPRLYAGETELSSLTDGWTEVRAAVGNRTGREQTAQCVMAYYREGRLMQTALSGLASIRPGGAEQLEAKMKLEGVQEGDCMKLLLLESGGTLRPLRKAETVSTEAPELPDEAALEALLKREHPRIMADGADFERIREDQDSQMEEWRGDVCRGAWAIGENLTFTDQRSQYYIGYQINVSDQLLEMSRRVLSYVTTTAMAYRLSEDPVYLDTMWRILQRAGLPQDASGMEPGYFPDWGTEHFLDTAEMTAAFAIGYDWCYDALSQEQRQYLEESILEYGLRAGARAYDSNAWWEKADNNWNVVCNGGMLIGAAAVAEVYPEEAFPLMVRALNGLRFLLPGFGPDGAWNEGPGYWEYTVQYLAKTVSTLEKSFGTEFGILAMPGIRKTGDFIVQMDGPTGIHNFHDAAYQHINAPELFWLAREYSRGDWANNRVGYMRANGKQGGPLDLLWYDPETPGAFAGTAQNAYFRDTETAVLRGSWEDSACAWVSVHGGKSNVNHGHLDGGSFVFDSMGVRWAEDLGPDNYALEGYFDDGSFSASKRWQYYRLRAEGHNTLVIGPKAEADQNPGGRAEIIRFEAREKDPFAVVKLDEMYQDSAQQVRRGIMLADNRQSLVIRDEILLDGAQEVYWFLHTKAVCEIQEDGTVILTRDGKQMRLELTADGGQSTVSIVKAQPLSLVDPEVSIPGYPNPGGQSGNGGYRKIMLKLRGAGGVSITAKLSPVGKDLAPLEEKPLIQWK